MISRLLLALVLCGSPLAAAQSLGETEFPNSGAPDAQTDFLTGLLLLHSFEYDDARDAFVRARQIDPGFAMAAWGEAMTHNHPVWQRQDRDAALAALRGVDRTGLTPREVAYLGTLDVLFGDGDKEARDDAYAEVMRELAEVYPDDLDAQTFYALALLGTAHEGRDFMIYMRAAAVLEDVFARNPQHPGAAHYLIHAYDDPVHAPLGLRPALVYADVAPAASHALHMPSHIYLALGRWQDVATMNERSYLAAKEGTDRRGDPLNGHGWHALWWWHYAATQLDDAELAARLWQLAETHHQQGESHTSWAHVVRIRAQQADMGESDAILAEAPPPASVGLGTQAIDALSRGERIADRDGPDAARPILAALSAAIAEGSDPPWTARAAALQLDGYLTLLDGDPVRATALVREAAALEAEAPLMFGPPTPTTPAHEFYGLLLLEYGDPAAAAEAYQTSLARAPNRRQSVYGLTRSRRALGEAIPAGAEGE